MLRWPDCRNVGDVGGLRVAGAPAVLDAVHGTYGDAGTYLRHGMTATQLTRFRTRLL